MRLDEKLERLGLGPELSAWSASRTGAHRLWEECPRGDWLLALATRVGTDRRLVVAAALDCARMAQCFVPAEERRPGFALTAASRWIEGRASGARCWAAGFHAAAAANGVAQRDEAASAAAMAAACVAFASDAEADDAYYAARAHAAEAAQLAARAYRHTRANAHRVCAEFVRYRIEAAAVLGRLDDALRSSLPPPPPDTATPSSGLHPHAWFDPGHITS